MRHAKQLKPAAVKRSMHAKGWTGKDAADELGVTQQHISYVLNGERESQSLLERIDALPTRLQEDLK